MLLLFAFTRLRCLPCEVCVVLFARMMMLLMMNKVVQRADRVLQPSGAVVYSVLSSCVLVFSYVHERT